MTTTTANDNSSGDYQLLPDNCSIPINETTEQQAKKLKTEQTGSLDCAIANTGSVRLSVCYTCDPCLNGSRYRTHFAPHDKTFLVSSNLVVLSLAVAPNGVLKR